MTNGDGTSKPDMTSEQLNREIASQIIINKTDAFTELSTRRDIELWIKSLFQKVSPDIGVRDFKWISTPTGTLKRRFAVRSWPMEGIAEPSEWAVDLNTDQSIRLMFSTQIEGELELSSSRLTKITTTFQNNAISISGDAKKVPATKAIASSPNIFGVVIM